MEALNNLAEEPVLAYAAPVALGIKSWAEEDRPREKLMAKGRATLSCCKVWATTSTNWPARV